MFVFMNAAFTYGRGRLGLSNFVSLEDVLRRLPLAFVVTPIFTYFFSKILPKKAKTMICRDCETTKRDDSVSECSCGGRFEDLDTLKWVCNDREVVQQESYIPPRNISKLIGLEEFMQHGMKLDEIQNVPVYAQKQIVCNCYDVFFRSRYFLRLENIFSQFMFFGFISSVVLGYC